MAQTTGECDDLVPQTPEKGQILQAFQTAHYSDGQAEGTGLGAIYLLIVKLRPVFIVVIFVTWGMNAESVVEFLKSVSW